MYIDVCICRTESDSYVAIAPSFREVKVSPAQEVITERGRAIVEKVVTIDNEREEYEFIIALISRLSIADVVKILKVASYEKIDWGKKNGN